MYFGFLADWGFLMKKSAYSEFLFNQGNNYRTYEYLGAHLAEDNQQNSFVFRVWAPNADNVYLCGDFNGWSTDNPMSFDNESGIWTLFIKIEGFGNGSRYKYIIERDGVLRYKADPYAFYSETKSKTASLFFDIDNFEWSDKEYLERRLKLADHLKNDQALPLPMNIYEVHLGSWKKTPSGYYLTYEEYAKLLSDYVVEMGYTHVEIMGIAEYPFEQSWGYQVCGYFAPTSRYGNPHDFMKFVDIMHSKGIGVIVDWVAAHFPKDAHGLYEFDGAPLYEYQGHDRIENRTWGTRYFDVGRTQVQSFLISNAFYWFEKYHIDGLRVDAVASMLYLDYDKEPGSWNPNPDGSNINIQAVEFFKKLNKARTNHHPDCLMIAEESTDYVNVTGKDGLGFDIKWNMGWMNDSLKYLSLDPYFRYYNHNKLSFSMMYSFNERFLLPISHDEVVHGKKSLLDKASGDYDQKFATTRTYLTYMMTHPGKKLMFMGSEYGQFREWDFADELEWFMLDFDKHRQLWEFVKALNHTYIDSPPLWEIDGSWDGFRWIYADKSEDNLYAYVRMDKSENKVLTVLNFSAKGYKDYMIPVEEYGWYHTLINTDAMDFGGTDDSRSKAIRAKKVAEGKYALFLDIPPLSGRVLSKDIKTNK